MGSVCLTCDFSYKVVSVIIIKKVQVGNDQEKEQSLVYLVFSWRYPISSPTSARCLGLLGVLLHLEES